MQLALNVDNLDEAIAFYSKLFNTTLAKVKAGYANFAIVEPPFKLVLLENAGQGAPSTISAWKSPRVPPCMLRSPG